MPKLSNEARLARILKSYATKQHQTCLSDCQKAFNKLVRIANADNEGYCQCVTCPARHKWDSGLIHAGHFIPAGRAANLRFDERNAHIQCVQCNHYLSGNMAVYREYMIQQMGEDSVEQLEIEGRITRSYSKIELAEMKLQFLDEIKQHEKRLV